MGIFDAPGISKALADGRFRQSPTSKLRGFHGALGRRAYAPVDILLIADSIGEGVGVDVSPLSNRWANQFLSALRQQFPVPGAPGGFGYKASYNTTGISQPLTIGTVTQVAVGLGHRSLQLGAGASVTFTEQCSSFKLFLRRSGTDAVTVAVDGGAATPVAAGPTGEFVYSSGALISRTIHSIVVTQTAGAPVVEGVMVFDGDENAGIRLWDCAKGGAKAADWVTAKGGSQAWLAAAVNAAFTPSLVVISLGTNDARAVGAATYGANISALVGVVRDQWANVPILLVGSYQPPSLQDFNLIEPWVNYGNSLAAIAAGDSSIAFVDLMRTIGSIPTDVYGLLNDITHPNLRGSHLYAETILNFVLHGTKADSSAFNASQGYIDQLWLDTPGPSGSATGPAIATPPRGGVFYADGPNAAVLLKNAFGDTINQLGRLATFSTDVSPWRYAWRGGKYDGTGTVTVVLPSAVSPSLRFTFICTAAGSIVVKGATPGGNQQTINGANQKTVSGAYSFIEVMSVGNGGAGLGWVITAQGGTVT